MVEDIFGSYEMARIGLYQAAKTGHVKFLDCVQLKELGGKPEKAYIASGLNVKKSQATHDVMAYYYCLKLGNAKYVLAYDCDPEKKMDGQIWFPNGKYAAYEQDMMTESLSTVMKDLLSRYKNWSFPILFSTLHQARIEKLKLRLKDTEIGNKLMFSVWYDLVKDPYGPVWETVLGKKGSIGK